ncbi:hypothetical protein EDD18DRAFT_1112476 [Armillaria luteobubalina]|uniref:Ribonuclease H1 N-terminal domain-containing protein n=1 Tax=Armillaria luteobubalina TaxID=153913 RepID=A0AA39PFB7_9AGAR|nr:hypothetical protein EDD18DRAFT_1112476 [Armillaria luteobubalina]
MQLAQVIQALQPLGLIVDSTFITPDKSSNTQTRSVKGTQQGKTWYTVTVGYEVGIFQGWDIIAPLILHVSGPIYQRHPSHVAVQAHYDNTLQHGDMEIVPCDDRDLDDE